MESFLLGIGLGTSSVKAALVRADGTVLYSEAEKYDIEFPTAGFEEEDPDLWWKFWFQSVLSGASEFRFFVFGNECD